MKRQKFKAGDLARLGAELVTVIEVEGQWAKVKAFHKDQNQEPQDRLAADLRRAT